MSQLNNNYILTALIGSLSIASPTASATLLNVNSGGTFTMSYDRDAFANMNGGSAGGKAGIFNDRFYNAADSNYATQDGATLLNGRDGIESDANNLVFTLSGTTPLGPQATYRHAQATSTNFTIDSTTLAGTGSLGMLGVQAITVGVGPYAGSGMVYGDYSLNYDSSRSLWYLQNNIYFPAETYDLGNLVATISDANNWRLSGDLLLSDFNAGMLVGTAGSDVGNFCLGVGSFSGCAATSITPAAVPLPGAFWFTASAIISFVPQMRRKHKA